MCVKCCVALLVIHATTAAVVGQTLTWSGEAWSVRDNTGGPGPNTFSSRNVSVDADGALHLKISKAGKRWTCAELFSTRHFGYGTYEFTVASRSDRLDANVVLGLFSYPDNAADGTNELDIEYSRWGIPDGPNLSFTAYPSQKHHEQMSKSFDVQTATPATLNRYVWSPRSVLFQSLLDSGKSNHGIFARWQTPGSFATEVSHISMPVHINLWLFESSAPSDNLPVDVVLKRFAYTAAE